MNDNSLFVIDSSRAVETNSGDLILLDSVGATTDGGDAAAASASLTAAASASSAVGDDFIGVSGVIPAHLAVSSDARPDSSRKLQHKVDVGNRIYFTADPKSLISRASQFRVKDAKISLSPTSTSSSKADLLVASLLDHKSSAGNSRVKDALSKSIITDDFGRQEAIPSSKKSRRERKKAHLAEKESSKGANWFDMKRAEMTEEEKWDLKILKMRKALDPKTFYKGDDMKGLPRFFQKGTVVESKAEFYSSRIPKKQRKQTLADELLADSKFVDYGTAKMEERKKFDDDRKKRMRQKKHLQRMTAKKKGKK